LRRDRHGIWVFRVRVTDSEDEELWDTLVGVAYSVGAHDHPAGAVASDLDLMCERLAPLARDHSAALVGRVKLALQQPTALALLREQAILAALDANQARLGASLIQPALFDRRAERASAAQREVLQDVVTRCRDRLARTRRMQQPLARDPEPVFTVTRR
jgi:hypothetical protein